MTIDEFLNSKAFSRGDPVSYTLHYYDPPYGARNFTDTLKVALDNYKIIVRPSNSYIFIKIDQNFEDGSSEPFQIPEEWTNDD